MTEQRASANGYIVPERGSLWTKPQPILSQEHWDEIRDAVKLALDALGEGPATTDRDFCWRNLGYARTQLKRAQRRADKWKTREARKAFDAAEQAKAIQ